MNELNNTSSTTIYRDTWKITYDSLEQTAQDRVANPGPLLGGAECPAAQFTLAASDDNGATWRNLTPSETQELINRVALQPQCCQNAGTDCWATKNSTNIEFAGDPDQPPPPHS